MSAYPLSRTFIGDGAAFSTVPMDRFRVNLLQMHLILPLKKETLTGNILVPMILGKSTKDYPTYRLFSKKLDRMYGATAGSSAHKIGDRLVVTLTVTAIDDSFALQSEQLLRESAKVLCSMLFSPMIENGAFEEKTFRLQVQSLKDAIQAEINEKRRYALGQLNRMMFENEPAGLSRTDCLEELETYTPEMAAAAYERILDEAQIEIIHVGMGDAAPALEVFRKAFEGRTRHPAALSETCIRRGEGEVKEGISRFDVTQSKLCFGFRSDIGPTDRRLNAMRMMNAILGGTPTSKLFLNVREKMSLCYYCAASFDRTKGALVIDSGIEHDNIEKAREAILDQLRQMQQGDFTDTDMEYARLSLYNSFRSMNESAHAVSGYYLGQLMQGTEETPEMQCERIADVTREEIIEAANTLRLDSVYCLTCLEEEDA